MQTLEFQEIEIVSGGDYAREAAIAAGAAFGGSYGGAVGGAIGGFAGGLWYDWAASVGGSNVASVTDRYDRYQQY